MGQVTDDTISAKVVLYGAPGAGKSHTLHLIASKLKSTQKGELRTENIAGASVEILPVLLGVIKGRRTEFEFVAAPGDWDDHDARRQVLESVDGLIFVANANRNSLDGNRQSLMELKDLLRERGKSLVATPVVFQWNNAREPGSIAHDELAAELNEVRAPAFPVGMNDPKGIFHAFTTISKITLKKVREDFQSGVQSVAQAETANFPIIDAEPEVVTAEDIKIGPEVGIADEPIEDVTAPPVVVDEMGGPVALAGVVPEEGSFNDGEAPGDGRMTTDDVDDAVLRLDALERREPEPEPEPEPDWAMSELPTEDAQEFPLPATDDISVAEEESASFVPMPVVEVSAGGLEVVGTGDVVHVNGRIEVPVRVRARGRGLATELGDDIVTITIAIEFK